MLSQLFVSLLVTRSAEIVEVFIGCEEVSKNGTPGERRVLLKGVKANCNGVMKSPNIRQSNRVILLVSNS